MKFKRFLLLVSIPFVYLATSACTTTATGRSALILVPDSQMHALGVQSYQKILAKEKISKNKKLTATVERVGRRIAQVSGADFQWEFKLIDNDKVKNAFCLPGWQSCGLYGNPTCCRKRSRFSSYYGT